MAIRRKTSVITFVAIAMCVSAFVVLFSRHTVDDTQPSATGLLHKEAVEARRDVSLFREAAKALRAEMTLLAEHGRGVVRTSTSKLEGESLPYAAGAKEAPVKTIGAPEDEQDVNKDLQDRFREVFVHNLWRNSESRSGYGSTVRAAEGDMKFILKKVVEIYPDKKDITVVDLPCGDMNWMPHMVRKLERAGYTVHYHGYDIVPELIRANREKRIHSKGTYDFTLLDGTRAAPAKGDILISRDVVNHLPLLDGLKLLRNYVESGTPVLLLSNNRGKNDTPGQELKDRGGGGSRSVDLERPPFDFPKAKDYNGHLAYWENTDAKKALQAVSYPGWKYSSRLLSGGSQGSEGSERGWVE